MTTSVRRFVWKKFELLSTPPLLKEHLGSVEFDNDAEVDKILNSGAPTCVDDALADCKTRTDCSTSTSIPKYKEVCENNFEEDPKLFKDCMWNGFGHITRSESLQRRRNDSLASTCHIPASGFVDPKLYFLGRKKKTPNIECSAKDGLQAVHDKISDTGNVDVRAGTSDRSNVAGGNITKIYNAPQEIHYHNCLVTEDALNRRSSKSIERDENGTKDDVPRQSLDKKVGVFGGRVYNIARDPQSDRIVVTPRTNGGKSGHVGRLVKIPADNLVKHCKAAYRAKMFSNCRGLIDHIENEEQDVELCELGDAEALPTGPGAKIWSKYWMQGVSAQMQEGWKFLKKSTFKFRKKIDSRRRKKLLEFHGIPISANENLDKLVTDLVKNKLGIVLQPEEITDLYRLPAKTHLPPVVIVQFASVKKRNAIFECRKRLAGAIDFEIEGMTALYINECLTKYLKHLYYLARQLLKKSVIASLWTRNGKIWAKKDKYSTKVQVTSEDVLRHLGHEPYSN